MTTFVEYGKEVEINASRGSFVRLARPNKIIEEKSWWTGGRDSQWTHMHRWMGIAFR